MDPHRQNPLACAVAENDGDMANLLQESGWRLNLPAGTIELNIGADGVISLVEGFKPSPSQIAELLAQQYAAASGTTDEEEIARAKFQAHRFAEKLSSANLTLVEVKDFLDRKNSFHPMSIVTGRQLVDHSDGDQNIALFWAAWNCDAVAVDNLLRYGASLNYINRLRETSDGRRAGQNSSFASHRSRSPRNSQAAPGTPC